MSRSSSSRKRAKLLRWGNAVSVHAVTASSATSSTNALAVVKIRPWLFARIVEFSHQRLSVLSITSQAKQDVELCDGGYFGKLGYPIRLILCGSSLLLGHLVDRVLDLLDDFGERVGLLGRVGTRCAATAPGSCRIRPVGDRSRDSVGLSRRAGSGTSRLKTCKSRSWSFPERLCARRLVAVLLLIHVANEYEVFAHRAEVGLPLRKSALERPKTLAMSVNHRRGRTLGSAR